MRLPEIALLVLCLGACATGAGKDVDAKAPSANHLSAEGELNIGLAQGYLQSNQSKEAMERAQAALASDPGSASVHALLALVYSRTGDNKKAEREFSRALKIAPADGGVLNAHAAWLCERNQFAQADAEFNLALNDPRYHDSYQTLSNAGRCAHKSGQWSVAESYLRRVLPMAPDDPQVLMLMADSEFRQGNTLEARAFIQRRNALGANAQALDLAARIEDAAGNRQDAARNRQRLKDEFPNYAPTGEGVRQP